MIIEEKRDLIINVHFMMLHIAAKNQHVYAQWKKYLDVHDREGPGIIQDPLITSNSLV